MAIYMYTLFFIHVYKYKLTLYTCCVSISCQFIYTCQFDQSISLSDVWCILYQYIFMNETCAKCVDPGQMISRHLKALTLENDTASK